MQLSFGSIISFVAGAVVCAAVIGGGISTGSDEPAADSAPQDTTIQPAQQSPHKENVRSLERRTAVRADRSKQLPSHETVECCLKVAEDIDRNLADKLRQQHKINPDAFAVQLQYQGQRLLDLCELRSNDPALYSSKLLEMQYDAKINQIGLQLCKAADAGNEQLVVEYESELFGTLKMQLVFEIKSRGEFLLRLQEEVERLRAELDVMGSQFDTTVKTRLAEIKDCTLPLRPSWQQHSRAVVPVDEPIVIPAE